MRTHRTAPPLPGEPKPDRPIGSARRSRSVRCGRPAASSTPGPRRRPLGRGPSSPSRGPADTRAAACGVGERLHAGPTSDRRVLLALDAADPGQHPRRLLAVGAGVQLAPLLGQAVGPLHLGIAGGWPGGFQIGSTPSPINHNASSEGRSRDVPRGSRCRLARGRVGPSSRRPAEHLLDGAAAGYVPTDGGGETSVARMAPEASSVTVSQQIRWPVANGTFSTASTCQISWGWAASGTTTAPVRRRRGRWTPARTKARWRLRTEGRHAQARGCGAGVGSSRRPRRVFALEIAGDGQQFSGSSRDRTAPER